MSGTLKVGGKTLATHDTNTNVAKIQLGSTSDVVLTDSAGNNVLSESGGVVTLTADEANVGSNALVVDSSGNVLVGTTDTNPAGSNVEGISFGADGQIDASRNGGSLDLNRISTDGTIINFRKDGTAVGAIGAGGGGNCWIGTGDTGLFFGADIDAIIPYNTSILAARNNAIDLGRSVERFNDIYLGNAPNVSSDRNEKQDIEELTEAEHRVAVAAKSLMRKFRWKSAVAKKGDEARIHFGIIAQDLQAAFEAEGLDAGRYGMFMSNTWWETSETYTDDEGVEQTRTNTYYTAEEAPEGAVERTRLGIRYSELLAFIIAAI